MSAYRSDLEAALARNDELERQIRELRHTVTRLTTPPTTTTEIAELVAARDRAKAAFEQFEHGAQHAKAIVLARRPLRVAVARA